MLAAAELAVQDVNAGGGVLGGDVAVVHGDSGAASSGMAPRTVRRLVARGTDVLVGSASSAVSFMVMEQVAAANTVMISPASTAADLTTFDAHGRFFRTSPSDVLQGKALGEMMVDDGCRAVAVVALDGPYFTDLRSSAVKVLRRGGITVHRTLYGADTAHFGPVVRRALSTSPDCVAVMAFEEVTPVLNQLVSRGFTGENGTIYLSDASIDDRLGARVDGSLDNVRGLVPGASPSAEFTDRLAFVDGGIEASSFAPETYDAVIIAALAAEAAGYTDGPRIARQLPAVTRDGVRCTTYPSCASLLRAGRDIDYDGQSGSIEMDDRGDPRVVSFRTVGYDATAALVVTGERSVQAQRE